MCTHAEVIGITRVSLQDTINVGIGISSDEDVLRLVRCGLRGLLPKTPVGWARLVPHVAVERANRNVANASDTKNSKIKSTFDHARRGLHKRQVLAPTDGDTATCASSLGGRRWA